MKKLCFIIYTLTIFVTGCTHICKYSTFDELNSKIKDKEAKITLINEQNLMRKDVYITPDSTFWIDSNTGYKKSIITPKVSSVITKNRGRGMLDGLGLGLLIGAAMGAVIGSTEVYDVQGTFSFLSGMTRMEKTVLGPILLGCAGGLLGVPIGAIVGSNDKFIIEKKIRSIFNVKLSAYLTPNSNIKLEISPHDVLSIQNVLEKELSLKGFIVISEGQADYLLTFQYSTDKNKRLVRYTAYVTNLSTDKIIGVANFQNNTYREINATDIIKEFVNQLCPDII